MYTILIEIVVASWVSYSWGHLRAREQRQREDDQYAASLVSWSCDECGWGVVVPDLSTLLFMWRVHDENIVCPKKWTVT